MIRGVLSSEKSISPTPLTINCYSRGTSTPYTSRTLYLVYDSIKYSRNSYWLITELPADYTLVCAHGFIFWNNCIYSDTGSYLCIYYRGDADGYKVTYISNTTIILKKVHEVIIFKNNIPSNTTDGYRFTKFLDADHTKALCKEKVSSDVYEYVYNIDYSKGSVIKDKNHYYKGGILGFTQGDKIHKIADNINGYAYYYYDAEDNAAMYYCPCTEFKGDGHYESIYGKLNTGKYIQIFKIPVTELSYLYITDPDITTTVIEVDPNISYTYYTDEDYINLFNGIGSWIGGTYVSFNNSIFESDALAKIGLVSVSYGDLPVYRDYKSKYDGVSRQILFGKPGMIQYGKLSENYDAEGNFVNFRLHGDDSIVADGYKLDRPYQGAKYYKYYQNDNYSNYCYCRYLMMY